MVLVPVKLYSGLKEVIGKPTLVVQVPENSSVKDVLNKVTCQFKESLEQRYRWVEGEWDFLKYFMIFVNGTHLSHIGGLESKVRGGDVIEIREPISGG